MSDTLFHKIIRREIPADIVFEDEQVIAFRDIAPQAPVHVLFVPKQDFATLNDVPEGDAVVIGRLATAAARYAKAQGFAEDGYRIVMNCNGEGGQTVFQIHLHLLAGARRGRFGTAQKLGGYRGAVILGGTRKRPAGASRSAVGMISTGWPGPPCLRGDARAGRAAAPAVPRGCLPAHSAPG